MASAVSFQNVSKSFSKHTPFFFPTRSRTSTRALDNVTFDLRRGRILAILGPNGAGKTTLLRLISSLLVPDQGTVQVFDQETGSPSHRIRSEIATVFAGDRGFYWRLSVRENLLFFAALYNCTRQDAARKVIALAETFDFQDYLDQPFETLSTGYQHRVAIARSQLSSARLLIADEMTRSLDVTHRTVIHTLLRHLAQDGTTIVLATHDPNEAAAVADEAMLLNAGRIVRHFESSEWKDGRLSLGKELENVGH